MPTDTEGALDRIRADMALFDDWEDRYRYIIELGRSLDTFPEEMRTDANKVRGCASQVWLTSSLKSPAPGAPEVLDLRGDSDAHIVRGLVAVLLAVYQGKTPAEALSTDARSVFAEFGLKEHLTPQRSNGFSSMVERLQNDARSRLPSAPH